MILLFFDVETTTKNKGHPFNLDNFLVSYAANENYSYYKDPDFKTKFVKEFSAADELIGFNVKFDIHWIRRSFDVDIYPKKIWDCQIAEFILNNQKSAYLSLNEALASYGIASKIDKVKEYWDAGLDTTDVPLDVLEEYNRDDEKKTKALYFAQRAVMTPEQINLVYLLGEDMKTLIEMEANGIKWDSRVSTEKQELLKTAIEASTQELCKYLPPIVHGEFNWSSGDHLSALIYGGTIDFDYVVSEQTTYKSGDKKGQDYIRNRHFVESVVFPGMFKPLPRTEVKKTKDNPTATTRFYKVDEPTLLQLKGKHRKIVDILVERSEKQKVLEMIQSIEKKAKEMNWSDGKIHSNFNQSVVITGRLSSTNPNMQNTPMEVDSLLVSEYD